MRGFRLPVADTTRSYPFVIIVRAHRKRLFRLLSRNRFPMDLGTAGRRVFLKFDKISDLRRALKLLQLFEQSRYFKSRPKKKQVAGHKYPTVFNSDIQEEKTVSKEESAPPTSKKKRRRYRFKYRWMVASEYSQAIARVAYRRHRSRVSSIAAALLPGRNFITPKFLYKLAFTKNTAPALLRAYISRTPVLNLHALFASYNQIQLMLYIARLVQLRLIIGANHSSNIN